MNLSSPDTAPEQLDLIVGTPGFNLDSYQRAATAAYQASRTMPWAPIVALDAAWEQFRRESASAMRPTEPYPTPADRHRQTVACLGIALRATAHYRGIADRHGKMTDAERQAVWQRDKQGALNAVLATQDAAQREAGAAHAPKRSPVEFVASLARRGVSLHLGKGGRLMAVNAAALSAADKAVLAGHKAEIVALLSDTVDVA